MSSILFSCHMVQIEVFLEVLWILKNCSISLVFKAWPITQTLVSSELKGVSLSVLLMFVIKCYLLHMI